MVISNPLSRLAELLEASHAQPEITLERFAPSTIYDLEYRVITVAMAFHNHAAPDKFSSRPRIQGRRLKLLQFIAMRPWLLPVIREWSRVRNQAQSAFDEAGLRRGFIGDTMHDQVMDFLMAAGALRRDELFVISGPNSSVIPELNSLVTEHSILAAELSTLHQLKEITITNDMLEGW